MALRQNAIASAGAAVAAMIGPEVDTAAIAMTMMVMSDVGGTASAGTRPPPVTRRVSPMDAVAPDALIEDAAKKSGLIWVRATGLAHGVGPGREQPVWHVWQDGAVYVLTGGLEQPAPGGIDELPAPDGDGDRDGDEPHAIVTTRGKDGNS